MTESDKKKIVRLEQLETFRKDMKEAILELFLDSMYLDDDTGDVVLAVDNG